MAALLPSWLRALFFDPKDIVESREIVKKLNLPETTAQFVLALRPKDSPESVVYLLSSLYFSEKAVSNVRELISATQPKAVVALVDLECISGVKEEEKLAAESFEVPTSILGVIRENIERNPQVVPYKSRARVEVSKSVFGAGAYSDVLEAKASAAKVNASFRYVDFPYRSSPNHYDPSTNADDPESPSRESFEIQQSDAVNSAVDRRATQGLRSFATESPLNELRLWRESCSVALAQMFGDNESSAVAATPAQSTKSSDGLSENGENEVPGFAVQFLDVFRGLFSAFRSEALGQAYGHAMKVFQDVENGKEVNPSDLLETCRYRVALEMCRVRMNKSIRDSATKIPTRTANEFRHLSYEEKCHALLAQSLQKEARERGIVVAVVDVNRIPGIRQHWNQQIPEDVVPLIDDCYVSMEEVENVNILETLFPGTMKPNNPQASQEKKAAVVVGAGAAAAFGLAYLPHWAAPLTPLLKFSTVKASTLLKIGFLNSKRAVALAIAKGIPGASKVILPMQASAAKSASASAVKTVISAEKAQAAAQGLVSGLQRQTLQAIRTSFYSAMRGTQNKQVRRSAWFLFGGSVVAGSGMLWYGDKVERTLGSFAYAPNVAKLGRGLQSLSEAKHLTGLNWDTIYREVYNFKR